MNAAIILKSDEIIRLPTYLGKRSVTVSVEGIPPEVKAVWIAATILLCYEEEIAVL